MENLSKSVGDTGLQIGKEYPMTLLKQIRMARQMSMNEFAERMGVSGQTAYRYENGHRHLTLDTLLRAAEVLECRVSDLAGETELDQPMPHQKVVAAVDEASLEKAIESAAIAIIAAEQPLTVSAIAKLAPKHYRAITQNAEISTAISSKN